AGAPATDISVDLDGGPVFDLGVAEALARARWASDTECVTPGEPISLGRLQTAGTSVLSENGLVGLLDLNALLDMLDSLELVDTLGTFFSEASLIGLLDDAGAGVLADLLETLGLAPFLEQLVGGFGPILE